MTEVISVRFRGGCKTYYFDPRGVQVTAGEHVIVETAQGLEYAQCAEGNHEVPDEQVVEPFRPMVRIATDHDRRVLERNRAREKEAFDVCQKKILQHKLEMKLVRVECSFDGNKILFFFTADGRVDFRELVKDLASAFRARIELRQIGVRDEAKMLGGLGICGRPFCCAQFLDDFMPVSIKMAKTQSLSLNPTKISGTCGRLMCCLKYEQEAYEDAMFALLMDYVAESEGEKALEENRVLQEDPDAEVPQGVRRACLKEIHRAFRKKSARSVGRITMKVINKVALVALLGTLLFSTAFAISPEFRVGTLNMLIDTVNEGVSFRISTQPVSERAGLEDLYPNLIPDGYELIDEGAFAGTYWVDYQNSPGDRLEIELSPSGRFDIEDTELEPTQIHGLPAYIIDQLNLEGDNHGIIKVIVLNEAEGYILSVISIPHSTTAPPPISRDGIVHITESIFK